MKTIATSSTRPRSEYDRLQRLITDQKRSIARRGFMPRMGNNDKPVWYKRFRRLMS